MQVNCLILIFYLLDKTIIFIFTSNHAFTMILSPFNHRMLSPFNHIYTCKCHIITDHMTGPRK